MLGCKLCFNLDFMFLLFQIVEGVQVAGQYYVSDNRSTWMQASRQCSLATPDIDFHTLSVDISSSWFSDDLWLGYYVKYTAFEYIGCITTNGYSAKLSNMTMNLERCQSPCGDDMVIGINKTACFCFNKKPERNIHQSGCFDTCGKSTVCGGKGYMSLYRAIEEYETTTSDSKLCLKLENNDKEDTRFAWDKCENSLKTICAYDNGTVGLLNDTSRSWQDSVKECLRHKGLPTSLNSSRSFEQVTGPVWTGIIQSRAIYKFNEASFSKPPMNVLGFGYGSKDKDTAMLHDSKKNSEKLLKALCNSDLPVLPGNETLGNESTKRIGIIVGITVPLVIVVTASVVVLVVLIRRGKIPHIWKRKGTTSSKYVNTNTCTSMPDKSTPRARINLAYDQFDETVQNEQVHCCQETQKDETSSTHDYFVLEKDITYPKNTKNTMNGQSAVERENVNVYNTIESGATYNLTSYRSLNKEQKVNDKYDSLENAITGSSSYKTTYKPDDDTYNHTKGMPEVKNIKTDNIYGIQIQNVGLADTGDQDTYSHTKGMQEVKNIKTDNIYGIQIQNVGLADTGDQDTYSHTKGMQEVKNIKTDNIYGIQIQNVGLADTGDQDTYSHTKGMPELKNIKTDNIYGIQIQNVGLADTGDQDTYNLLNSKPVVKPDQIYGMPEQ